jgi:hypothetical protein
MAAVGHVQVGLLSNARPFGNTLVALRLSPHGQVKLGSL